MSPTAPRASTRTALAILVLAALHVSPALAQSGEPPAMRPGHVTVSGGIGWIGSYDIGAAAAELRGNAVGASGTPFTLFRASSSLDSSVAPEARLAVALTPSLAIESGFSYHRPNLTTSISSDAEASPVTLDAETLVQYIVDVAAVWHLPRVTVGSRGRPFIVAGGGYLRQLYDERTLVETGSVYFAGGGLRYWLRGGDGAGRSIGLRGEVRALWRRSGVEFEGKTRLAPAGGLHLFVEF